MPLDKALQIGRNVVPLPVTAVLQFTGDIFGDVPGPAFSGVEADDANRIGLLAPKQLRNYGFKVCGGLGVGLSPATPEIVEHQQTRDKGRGPITHDATPTTAMAKR